MADDVSAYSYTIPIACRQHLTLPQNPIQFIRLAVVFDTFDSKELKTTSFCDVLRF